VDDVVSPRRPHDPPWRSRHAHRNLNPEAAAMLADARAARGWTQVQAAAWTGISRRMIGILEAGQRVPSTVLVEALIDGYGLGLAEAAMLRAVALPNVGRDSPLRACSPNIRVPPNTGD
jgi:transcriptional regulator with XRE-family HTH domain